MSNRDPYTDGPAERGWSARSVAAAAVAMILVIAAISYAINNNSPRPPPVQARPARDRARSGRAPNKLRPPHPLGSQRHSAVVRVRTGSAR
jgi:hypothetical protein